MKKTKRQIQFDEALVNKDIISSEMPDIGLIATNSANDPKPSIKVVSGKIVEMDGVSIENFDSLDTFISQYGINIESAERAMAMDSTDIAKMIVDINVSRNELIDLCCGLTPAKLVEVVSKLNVVEIMMGQMKMRARCTPANQAHVVNIIDNPVLLAADAAEAAFRGFAEQETTCTVARMGPLNALSLLVGSQIGRPGVITQCSLEEASELKIGMKGFTSYAETISVYGTEAVMTDGGDTPWSKAFLASAYASRGIKMRFSSGSGSEVMMGNAEKKSMLYLEARCIWLTKACGAQGVQNGSIDALPISTSVPAGMKAVASENLIASMLGLEVASGNDTHFSHSLARSISKTMMQMLPGTDLINSGYSSVPNFDNTFAGSTLDCDNYPDFYMLQRDMQIDGGLHPVKEEDVIMIRSRAAKALQAIYYALDFPEITNEEVDAAVYAYSSKDMPPRQVAEDIKAANQIMNSDLTVFDIVKILYENGYEFDAKQILSMLHQRLAGDYLQTSAILTKDFRVLSAINNRNDYAGPGSGYHISDERWRTLKENMPCVTPNSYIEEKPILENMTLTELGIAQKGTSADEILIALSPSFGTTQVKTITEIPHYIILRELGAGIEEEGLSPRFIKCFHSSDLSVIASTGSRLSGSGISIGIQAKGTTVIHHKDLVPLDNLELFSLSPLYTPETYRHIGKNAAKYAKGLTPEPISGQCDMSIRYYMLKATVLHNHETRQIIADKQPVDVQISFL